MTKEQLKKIYNLYGRSIRNYIYYRSGNIDISDDITQETFIKVWEKQFEYDEQKNKSLLYKIANNLFIDYVRKNKIKTEYLDELKFKFKNDIEASEENDVLMKKCEKALADLTEKEKIVFLMSRKDQLKYKDIADRLGVSIKTVERRMSQALKKMRVNKYEK
ncbi:MAG: RNA polymerase sigma factor [Melioribacteraceae bacterium]|nr:RNA polymerase sigma factor [Melioribacteraceae bacterium]